MGKTMTILVTGAGGFVGPHLIRELADHGHKIIAVTGPHDAAAKSAHVSQYISADLLNAETVSGINFQQIDGVIHLAGLAAVGPSFDNPLRYITTNAGIEINLFEAALAQQAYPRCLIISSGSLYDPSSELPITEQSPALPNSPYAISKLAQEQLAHYYGTRGFDCIVARPFNHIGPGQNPGFLVPDLAQQVVAFERGKTAVVTVGNLDAQRDYTDVRDIVRAYRLLIESGVAGKIYNVCSGTPRSGHDILTSILSAAGNQPPVEQDPAKMRPSDTPIIYGSHATLTKDTGWRPTIDIQTTIDDVMDDWRSR